MQNLTLSEVKDKSEIDIVRDIDPGTVFPTDLAGALILDATGRFAHTTDVVVSSLLSEPDTVVDRTPTTRTVLDRPVLLLTQFIANHGRRVILAPGKHLTAEQEYELSPFSEMLTALRFTSRVTLRDTATGAGGGIITPPSSIIILDPQKIDPSLNIGVTDITPSFAKELTNR